MKKPSLIAKLVSIVTSLAIAFMLVPAFSPSKGQGISGTGVEIARAAAQAASFGALYNSGFNSAKSKFPKWARFLDGQGYVAYVPGLSSMNFGSNNYPLADGVCKDMVPQGIGTFGNYYLISAYCSKHTHSSVVYVLNKSNGRYVKTIRMGFKSHLGAVGMDNYGYNYINGQLLYNRPRVLLPNSETDDPFQHITEIQSDDFGESLSSSNDPEGISTSFGYNMYDIPFFKSGEPGMSCLTSCGVHTYTGHFDKSNASLNYMYALYHGNNTPESGRIALPFQIQGIEFWKSGGQTYLICMSSYGRKNASTLNIFKVNSPSDPWGVHYPVGKPIATVQFPNMGEDICVDNGHLLTCYESAAHTYQNGDGKGYCPYPIDRITSHYLRSLLSSGTSLRASARKTANAKGDGDAITELASGTCGEGLTWTLSSDGVLDVYGTGAMEDYARAADAPWSEYASSIKCVSLNSGATSLGDNSFAGCENLSSVYLPDTSTGEEPTSFEVGSKALADCPSLDTVVIEGPSVLSDDALEGVDGVQLQTGSDISGVPEDANVTVHEHEFEFVETVDATCGTNGYDLYRCSCGEEKTENPVAATGEHDYQLTSTEASTCKEAGIEMFTCSKCGHSYTAALPLAEHNWVSGSEVDDEGMVTDTCSVCGETRTRSELIDSVTYNRAEDNQLVEAIGCSVKEQDGVEQLWYDARCGVGDQIAIEGDASVAGTYVCTTAPLASAAADGEDATDEDAGADAPAATNMKGYVFEDDRGRTLDTADLFMADDQSDDNLWSPEQPGQMTITYKGVSGTAVVPIKSNNIKDLSYTPAATHAFIEGKTGSYLKDSDGKVYFRYDLQFEQGDVVTLNMKDGTSHDYTYNGETFVDGEGASLLGPVDLSSEQEYEHWTVAEGGTVTLRYLNRSGKSTVDVQTDSEHDGQYRIVFLHDDNPAVVEYVEPGTKLAAGKIPATAAPRYNYEGLHIRGVWTGEDEEGNEYALEDLSRPITANLFFTETTEQGECQFAKGSDASGNTVYTCRICGYACYSIDDPDGTPASGNSGAAQRSGLAVGKTATVDGCVYKATSKDAVTLTKGAKKKSVTVPATMRIRGRAYKVTAIGANAFKGNKKVQKLVIGENVASIGKAAFLKCAKLKSIVIKTKKLKATKVGAKAFSRVSKKAKVKCGKVAKAYKKWLYKKGLPKKAKVKK